MAKKVAEIREELIKAGLDEKLVNGTKGKSKLLELYEKHTNNESIEGLKVSENSEIEEELLDAASEALNDNEENGNGETIRLSSDRIMSMFRKNELQDNAPKVNGLRRVATELIGPICNEDIKIIPFEFKSSLGIMTGMAVKFSITFFCEDTSFYGEAGTKVTFCDASDCIPSYNCSDPAFGKFMTALATTRAEARVLRKALQLDTVSAEEMDDGEPDGGSFYRENNSNSDKITVAQKTALINMCKHKGIDLTDVFKEAGYDGIKIDDLIKEDFHKCSAIISNKKGIENE